MNLRQLEYFITAAECKNMTEAARKLHMAQPPLSRAIKTLEESLDITLFFRSKKGIQLTDAGRLLYQQTTHLFREIEDIQTNIREMSGELCGNIKIGACYSTLPIVSERIQVFLSRHPACTFSMIQGTIHELGTDLRDGLIDMLFLRNCIVDGAEFVHMTLPEDPLCLVVHKELDTQPDNATPDITYLQDLPLCVLDESRSAGLNSFLYSACSDHHITPRIVCKCYDNSAGLALALSKVSGAFLPLSSVAFDNYPALNVKYIQGLDMSSRVTLIYNPYVYHTCSVQEFLSLFSNEPSNG